MFSAWDFLQHFPSLGRCCFPRVCFHPEWKDCPQDSRMPEMMKNSLRAQFHIVSSKNGYCLCAKPQGGLCVSVTSVVLHEQRGFKQRTLQTINTVSSSIQASCMCHAQGSQPHHGAGCCLDCTMRYWLTTRADNLLLTQPRLSRHVSIPLHSHSLMKD